MFIPIKLLITLSLLCAPVFSSSFVSVMPAVSIENKLDPGYSALKLFLEDEQHLTTIRRIRAVLSFGGISEPSIKIVDEIADSSSTALEQLEQLVRNQPAVNIIPFSNDMIGKATLDSIRMATVKDFIFDGDGFEKDLFISQMQILKVISHLATQLAEQESDAKRARWLEQLAKQYEDLYILVYNRIVLI